MGHCSAWFIGIEMRFLHTQEQIINDPGGKTKVIHIYITLNAQCPLARFWMHAFPEFIWTLFQELSVKFLRK